MAASLVAQTTGSGVAQNQTITLSATAGNVLVMLFARSGGLSTGAITSITDTGGNTWSVVTRGATSGVTYTRIEMWTCTATASPGTITVNSGTSQNNAWNISEWSGLTGPTADVASADNSTNASSTSQTPPSVTTTQAGDLVISAIHYPTAATTTFSGTGWTEFTAFNYSTNGSARAAYEIASSSGATTEPTWTLSAAEAPGVLTAAFKVASGGGSVTGTADSTGTATVAAAGVVGTSTGSTETVTATIASAGVVGKSTGSTQTVTAAATAAGAVGKSTGSSATATATIAAGGTVSSGLTGGATETVTAAVAASGVVGLSTGSTSTTSVSTSADGVVGVPSSNQGQFFAFF